MVAEVGNGDDVSDKRDAEVQWVAWASCPRSFQCIPVCCRSCFESAEGKRSASPSTFPIQFKEWRKRIGCTQAEMAEKFFKVSPQTIYNWEMRKVPIPGPVVIASAGWSRGLYLPDGVVEEY